MKLGVCVTVPLKLSYWLSSSYVKRVKMLQPAIIRVIKGVIENQSQGVIQTQIYILNLSL